MWFDLIKMLVKIVQHKKETDIKKKESISKLYFQMSELLVEAAKDLSQDIYPQGRCATMWALSEDVLKHLKDKVNDEELKLISELLHSCSQLEKEYSRRKEPGTITEMFDAAGRFQSLSILYSV